MNKQFETFLKEKQRARQRFEDDYNSCQHDKNHWCQNCIAKPQLTSVIMPDGTVSTGYVITNF